MRCFKKIAITPPQISPAVIERCKILLQNGSAAILHLRFPNATEIEMREVIEAIPKELYERIKLHSHYGLVEEYCLRGFHHNGNSPIEIQIRGGISKSCHSMEEVRQCVGKGYEYVTLSPVYDSISKAGYRGNEGLLNEPLPEGEEVIAMGGVTTEKFDELAEYGFAGAAMIGQYFKDLI